MPHLPLTQGPNSPPIVCHVYPSRQKVLAELVQKQKLYMQQQQAAAAAAAARPGSHLGAGSPTAAGGANSPSRVRLATPGGGSGGGAGGAAQSPLGSPGTRVAGFQAAAAGALLGDAADKGAMQTVASAGQLAEQGRGDAPNGNSQPLTRVQVRDGS